MVQLLEKESFDQITTVELAQESGISRSSFYTHYRDKYDMIERYQQALFHKLEYIFDKHQDDKRQAITEVFEFLTKEPLFAVLLTENGTKERSKPSYDINYRFFWLIVCKSAIVINH